MTTPTTPTTPAPSTSPATARAHGSVAAALARARSPEEPGPDRDPGPLVPARPGPALPVPPAGPGELPLETVLRLSLAAVERSGRLRPHPSAGGCHPVGAHLLVGPGCPLPPGRYAYDPLTHRVHARGPAPAGAPAGAVVVLTVTPRRTAAHYGHRAWPLLLLDAGHAAAALVLAARAHGAAGTPVRPAVCPDAPGPLLAAAAGLDRPAGEEDEHPLAAVRLTTPETASDPRPLARWADGGAGGGRARPTVGEDGDDGGEDAGALLRVLTDASPHGTGEDWWTPPAVRPAPTARDLLARRSAPPPLTDAVDHADLGAVLAAASAADPAGLTWCAAVGGPRPALLAPDRTPAPDAPGGPRRLAVGEARPTLALWAARQGWIADAGAVLLACGCPDDAPPHRVRAAHLGAGHAVGTAQAVATRLGLRSRPIGSWQGADLGAALGERPGRTWVVHGLALAGPARKERKEGARP
ncbi:hypothetical protein [Streptomyces macrosporus]|uniref:Nitroreductase n=1 Tax=Streptomyces macrosporus TaxID=44032 RepID=A0ABP5XBG6_9ACTN